MSHITLLAAWCACVLWGTRRCPIHLSKTAFKTGVCMTPAKNLSK